MLGDLGSGNIRRLLSCDKSSAKATALGQVSEAHVTMVIVNTSQYGGAGGEVATFSTAPSAAEIGLHEMGHTAFHVADEYDYYAGCSSGETGHGNYNLGEPVEANVTANTNSATIKWQAQLTNPADVLPTTTNTDCATCDAQGNPQAAPYVGADEGARYFHCGCYRPSFNCRMRELNYSFCAVCQGWIATALQGGQAARGSQHLRQRHAARRRDQHRSLQRHRAGADAGHRCRHARDGAGRMAAIGHINGPELDPAGATSIGAGVVAGKEALDTASPPYDVNAMLVLTDGQENTPPRLADVAGSITANTFAIGLGRPENISVAALDALTQGHNGYLLITGMLTPDQSAAAWCAAIRDNPLAPVCRPAGMCAERQALRARGEKPTDQWRGRPGARRPRGGARHGRVRRRSADRRTPARRRDRRPR